MDTSAKRLISTLNETFNGNPWYGDSVITKLTGIDYQIVNYVPANSTNSIAKIVQHMINWRVFAIEKIKGNFAYEIQLNSKEDWTDIIIRNQPDWDKLLLRLRNTHTEIVNILAQNKDEKFLKKITSGREYDFQYLVEGIIQHDIYHLGQIGIIHRQVEAKSTTANTI